MQREIRLGLVGYGHRGAGLLQLARGVDAGITPAAICDRQADLRKKAQTEFPGIPLFADYDEMLKSVPLDALLVATPATEHAEFSARALKNNIHVFSEIPTVHALDEAPRLWAAHRQSRALYMTGANPNMWAFVDAAADLKKQGLLGEPYYMEAEYIHDLRYLFAETPWRATYESIYYCTHSLGPLLRLIDEDFEWVSCFDTGSHVNRVQGQHDAMAALFRTRSNVVVRLLTTFINNYPSEGHHYRIFTTKGAFERTLPYGAECPARTLFYSTDADGKRQWTTLPSALARPEQAGNRQADGHGGADYALLEGFFKAIREGLPSPISLREGLRMTLPGIYAAESARQGGRLMQIEYPWSQDRQ